PGLPRNAKPEPPAPKGFFDDIPGLPNNARPEAPAPKGFFDDLPRPGHSAAAADGTGPELQLDSGAGALPSAPGAASQSAQSALDPVATPRAASSFDDLDLSRPSTPPVRLDGAVRFDN